MIKNDRGTSRGTFQDIGYQIIFDFLMYDAVHLLGAQSSLNFFPRFLHFNQITLEKKTKMKFDHIILLCVLWASK